MGTYTPEEFQKKIKRFAKKQPELLKRALAKSAEMVTSEALTKHLSGPKMARGVGSKTNATLQPSRAADLRTSVNWKVKVNSSRQIAQVSSNMKYSRIHELGGTINHNNLFGKGIKATIKMPARPYLSSSLKAKRREIVDNILEAMIEGYKRT